MVDFNQKIWRFAGGLVVILGIGLVIWSLGIFLDPEAREARQAKAYLEDLQEQYENDTYGGETPEETLALFIEALETGDIELASKYFVIDKQEGWLKNLKRIQGEELLVGMVEDLRNRKEDEIDNNTARYYLVSEDQQASPVVLIKAVNNRWKIRTL